MPEFSTLQTTIQIHHLFKNQVHRFSTIWWACHILDKKEVDRGIIGNIEYAITYLKELVPIRFEIKILKRDEFPEYPIEAYREAIS